jgi:hypothetical protein
VVFLAIVFAVARLGYILGKRFLREYPQPTRKTWGEDDDYVHSTLAEGEADSGERAESSSENEEEPQTEHVQET